MALRYRNEHVINSLRAAYSLTHRDDSLLLNDQYEADILAPEPGVTEAYVNALNHRIQTEGIIGNRPDARSRSSQSTTRSDSADQGSLIARSTTASNSEFESEEVAELNRNNTITVERLRSRRQSIGLDDTFANTERTPRSSLDRTDGSQGLQSNAPSIKLASSLDSGPKHDFTLSTNRISGSRRASMEQSLELTAVHAQSFTNVRDFGLDMEDESDFEDDFLRATREIKNSARTPQPVNHPRWNSRSSQRSGSNNSGKGQNVFNSSDMFAKRNDQLAAPSATSSKFSQLTNQLTATQLDPREQYLEATTGLKSGQSQGLRLTIHMRGTSPLKVTVKLDCSTHLAIGYALYTGKTELSDANMYNLRLAEDDGEPDEDFPALDRTRPIASYQVDEFALVEATETEFRENSKRTPNKVSFKSQKKIPLPLTRDPSSKASLSAQLGPHPNSQTTTKQAPVLHMAQSTAHHNGHDVNTNGMHSSILPRSPISRHTSLTFSDNGPRGDRNSRNSLHFDHSTTSPFPPGTNESSSNRSSVNYASSFGDGRNDFVVVKMYMHPYDPILSQPFWLDEMVQKQYTLSEVFELMCREKMMDSDMYVLRTTEQTRSDTQQTQSSQKLPNMKAAVQSLATKPIPRILPTISVGPNLASVAPEDETLTVTLEIVPKRQLQGGHNSLPHSVTSQSVNSQLGDKEVPNKPANELQNAVLAMQPLGFYKYPVVRRQQMNFLGRSERELVIDGEYVHIMPPTDWSLLDQPKTTTFHIRQVDRVKQSRKVRTNFSIIVFKSSGPKRYDLECKEAATSAEIVSQLQRLQRACKKPIM